MDTDYYVNVIINSRIPFNDYYIGPLRQKHSLFLSRYYQQQYDKACLEGLLTQDELFSLLEQHGIKVQETLDTIGNISRSSEDIKISIFENFSKPNVVERLKKDLRRNELQIDFYSNNINHFEYFSCEGFAKLCKIEAKLLLSLMDEEDNYIHTEKDFLDSYIPTTSLINVSNKHRLDDKEYRRIARTEPWKSMWGISKEAIFGDMHISEWSEPQKIIVNYSKMYDSIYEHYEFPGERVLQDDDALDGWLLTQNRKRNDGSKTTQNEKDIPQNADVFVPISREVVDPVTGQRKFVIDKEKVRDVDQLNSPQAKAGKQEVLQTIDKMGKIKDSDIPSISRELAMRRNRLYSEAVKQRQQKRGLF